MWLILVKYTEGTRIYKDGFSERERAENWLEKHADLDGPAYAIVEVKHWKKWTSNPHWTIERG